MKTIEARAIISARDATGMVFNAISSKIAKLNAAAKSASSRASAAIARTETVGRGAGSRPVGPIAAGAARAVTGVGAGLVGLPGLGAAGAVYGAVQAQKRYAETDLVLTRIGITADATDEQMKSLDKTVRDTAFNTATGFDKVAKGLDSMVAGGVDLQKALAILPSVTKTAQASGAEVEDMANTALALGQSLGVAEDKMQGAFDTLVKGGKMGKFELKDMSRYMASFGPIAAAAGYKGQQGLEKMVAVLQTIRQGSGSSEEAASSFTDLLGKMETDETSNKFKKFGIDIRKELDLTRKSGGDLIERFVELSRQALKGDLSKLPLLAGDKEMRRGLLALLTYSDEWKKFQAEIKTASGATAADLDKVLSRPQMALNRLSESFDRLKTSAGAALDSIGTSTAMDKLARLLEGGLEEKALSPEQKLQRENERRRKEGLAPGIEALENRIRELEAPGGTEVGGAAKAWRLLNGKQPLDLKKELENARIKLLAMQGTRDAADAQNRQMFAPTEVERWRQEESVRGTTVEFDGMTGDKTKDRAALNRKRLSTKMGWNLPSPSASTNYDATELPYQGGGEPDRRAASEPQAVTVSGEMSGKLENIIRIEAPELIKAYAESKAAVAEMRGLVRQGNGPGSTGRSSPDAGAPSVGRGGM